MWPAKPMKWAVPLRPPWTIFRPHSRACFAGRSLCRLQPTSGSRKLFAGSTRSSTVSFTNDARPARTRAICCPCCCARGTRVAEELDHVLGGRAPTMADLPRLRYTEHIVQESMRLYPPAYVIGREPL